MGHRVGVVSQKHLECADFAASAHAASRINCFHEIEAALAYLLCSTLDEIFIDQDIINDKSTCATRYINQIKQLHPDLLVSTIDISPTKQTPSSLEIKYFPKLETLFTQGKLTTSFQPIVEASADGDKIYGYECLSRINYRNHDYPPDFIFNYAQEKLELVKYDLACLSQALKAAPKFDNINIFVNIRPQTLVSKNFLPWFKQELLDNQISPKSLIVEVTEHFCTISESDFKKQCMLLKSLGLKIAIDDFGSGISNLGLFEIIEPEILKISGRFIKNIHLSTTKQKIIKNIIQLAQDFSIKAIVENVEHSEEWECAKSIGASLAQGYYFHRPLQKNSIVNLLSK